MTDDPVPPPAPLTEPRFPGRDRIMAGGAALGLIVIVVALLTLPTADNPILPTAATAPTDTTHRAEPAPIPPPAAAVAATPAVTPPPPQAAPPPAEKPATGQISAGTLPAGSIVRLDGKGVSRRRFTVAPGRHVIEVTAAGYQQRTDTVQVAAGQQLVWSPKLVALPPAKNAATDPPPRRSSPDDALCRQQMASASWRDGFATCLRAAQGGSAAAQASVARMFQRGDGVRRSDDSAAKWFGQAARSGDQESMYQLGIAYERGRGVSKDQAVALDWYTRSANAGHTEAQFVVGEICEKGRLGVIKDKTRALEWYKRAAAQGHKAAINKVRELER